MKFLLLANIGDFLKDISFKFSHLYIIADKYGLVPVIIVGISLIISLYFFVLEAKEYIKKHNIFVHIKNEKIRWILICILFAPWVIGTFFVLSINESDLIIIPDYKIRNINTLLDEPREKDSLYIITYQFENASKPFAIINNAFAYFKIPNGSIYLDSIKNKTVESLGDGSTLVGIGPFDLLDTIKGVPFRLFLNYNYLKKNGSCEIVSISYSEKNQNGVSINTVAYPFSGGIEIRNSSSKFKIPDIIINHSIKSAPSNNNRIVNLEEIKTTNPNYKITNYIQTGLGSQQSNESKQKEEKIKIPEIPITEPNSQEPSKNNEEIDIPEIDDSYPNSNEEVIKIPEIGPEK